MSVLVMWIWGGSLCDATVCLCCYLHVCLGPLEPLAFVSKCYRTTKLLTSGGYFCTHRLLSQSLHMIRGGAVVEVGPGNVELYCWFPCVFMLRARIDYTSLIRTLSFILLTGVLVLSSLRTRHSPHPHLLKIQLCSMPIQAQVSVLHSIWLNLRQEFSNVPVSCKMCG